ncbi:MAG: hypothetical protein JJE40_00160 [Vicinamibacteria bacterium]|nr:hypothetical protein [Vicinamibacteria bacterium]
MRHIAVDAAVFSGSVPEAYARVTQWLIELDDRGVPSREIGLGDDRGPLYCAPRDGDRGLFTDSACLFGSDWTDKIGAHQFEDLWSLAQAADS